VRLATTRPARVYVAGLSAGGAAATVMASTYADLYAAVAIHSGLASGTAHDIPSAFAAMSRGARLREDPGGRSIVPAIVFHGDRDQTVNRQNAELILKQVVGDMALEKHLERGQIPGGYAYTRTCYADPTGLVLLEAWVVHGEAHAWSGGSRDGSCTDPNGPDATREMLRFFADHPRPGTG
jgi:poly(3-hydroxybutyrate) depolymerase